MNLTRIAIAWLSDTEPIAVPVDSAVARLSDDLVLVLAPDGRMFAVFTGTSTTMLVPDHASADLRREHFDSGPVQVLNDRHP